MVAIPKQETMTPQQAAQRLAAWYQTKQQLAAIKTAEMLERKALVLHYVPNAVEGTNRVDLGVAADGKPYDLVVKCTINRKVDEAALADVKAAQAKKLKLNLDELFPMKPSLSLTEYRKLTDEQRDFVDGLLDIEEGAPSVDIVVQSDEETKARAAAHKAPPAPPAPAAPDVTVVANAEDAQPGNYFTDGDGGWWQLTDEWQWAECADPTVAAAPARAPRKAATKKAVAKKTPAKKAAKKVTRR